MTRARIKLALKLAGLAVLLLLAAGVIAPYLRADQFGNRVKWSLQRALGREVEIGRVRFSLFTGPGFSIEKVVIHEDPSVGIEPVAYVDTLTAVPRLWALLGGHFDIASIRLEDCDINLTKTGAPSEPGRWNFQSLVPRSLMAAFPGIHVRNGRINFKFGDTKSVFYLMNTDLDISPPSHGHVWSYSFSGEPARTDRPARGLGAFTAKGKWMAAEGNTPDHLDMNLVLEQTGLGEIIALLHGQKIGIHGNVSSRVHLAGPLHEIGISGQLRIEDVHRWDMLPPKDGGWPLYVRGSLDLPAQRLELESSSTEKAPLPLSVRFRLSNYLAQPHWGVTLNWNRFPLQPLIELARHMGIAIPPKFQLAGTIDGALGYSDQTSFQGEVAFRDTALNIPDSPTVRFEHAQLLFDQGHVRLTPAIVRTPEDQARLEADYAWATDDLRMTIGTEGMKVASLRAQVALAAVPWLEQVQSGQWSGELRYRKTGELPATWEGELEVAGTDVPVSGLAHPVQLASARARIAGARVLLDRIRASVGAVSFTGEYRYEPEVARPHRVRLVFDELDAAELERELTPTLRRGGGLIARALGRAPVPDWLKQRSIEGTIQAGAVLLAGTRLERARGHLLWDGVRLEVDGLRATLDGGQISGRLTTSLRGARPAYKISAAMKGMDWQSGKLDAQGTVETSGTGPQLLANLSSEGVFSGRGLDFGAQPPWKTVAGNYQLTWLGVAPKLRISDLQLATADEVFTGRGGTDDEGRLVVLLSNGTREMRVSGTLAKLHLEEPLRQ